MAEVRTSKESPEQAYYENEALWAQDFEQDPQERLRLDAASQLIPQGVNSILDVGCGNGAFVNRLAGKYVRVCGVDRSEVALSFVRTERRLARADQLPFASGEFDLVTCMEVIEHLPQGVYEQGLAEIVRVASKWVLISVPYREDRRLSLVRCPKCLCEFNRNYHMRSFGESNLSSLHPDIGLESLHKLGETVRYIGLRTARRMAEPFRTPPLPRGVVCPQCAHSRGAATPGGTLNERPGALGRARILWPRVRSPRWAMAMYRKRATDGRLQRGDT